MRKFHADSMAQDLKSTMRLTSDWEDLRPDAREVLDRLQSAIGRIIAGEGGEKFREILNEAIEVGGGKADDDIVDAELDLNGGKANEPR